MRTATFSVDAVPHSAPRRGLEISLYSWIEEEIRNRLEDENFDDCIVRSSGQRGSQDTGGRWTRPDITAVAYRQFKLLPGGHIELHTYEVKTGAGVDLTALHEALAHRRRAHRAYVLVDCESEKERDRVASLLTDARNLGVGRISYFSVESDWDVWFDPPVHHPELVELDEYLFRLLSIDERRRVADWAGAARSDA